MEFLSFLRMIGSLALVLGLLVGALFLVRRYELRLPQAWLGRIGGSAAQRRLQLVERLALDPRRSLVLVRRDEREFTLVIAPEGLLLLDGSDARPATDIADLSAISSTDTAETDQNA